MTKSKKRKAAAFEFRYALGKHCLSPVLSNLLEASLFGKCSKGDKQRGVGLADGQKESSCILRDLSPGRLLRISNTPFGVGSMISEQVLMSKASCLDRFSSVLF